jgi:hypothetical protein
VKIFRLIQGYTMSIQKNYNYIWFIVYLQYSNIMISLALDPTFIIYTYDVYIVNIYINVLNKFLF